MRLNIEGDLYLSIDNLNFTIEKKIVTKTGKTAGAERYEGLHHYSTLAECVKRLVRMKIAESEATTLKELQADVLRIEADLKKAISF